MSLHDLALLLIVSKDDGSMNKVKRDEALQIIRTSKTTRVILISFKAGSTGKHHPIRPLLETHSLVPRFEFDVL